MEDSFSKPSLISAITPAIQTMILPTIKLAIDSAIESAVASVKSYISNELIQINNKLQDTIDTQKKGHSQAAGTDNQQNEINKKANELKALNK